MYGEGAEGCRDIPERRMLTRMVWWSMTRDDVMMSKGATREAGSDDGKVGDSSRRIDAARHGTRGRGHGAETMYLGFLDV